MKREDLDSFKGVTVDWSEKDSRRDRPLERERLEWNIKVLVHIRAIMIVLIHADNSAVPSPIECV